MSLNVIHMCSVHQKFLSISQIRRRNRIEIRTKYNDSKLKSIAVIVIFVFCYCIITVIFTIILLVTKK